MIDYKSLGHINIVVDDIEKAIKYYTELFFCRPKQFFPHFKNVGFSKSAGFIDRVVDVSICFLEIPNTGIFLELMEYHDPIGYKSSVEKKTNNIGGVGHICIKVGNIDYAFNHIKNTKDTKLISLSEKYKPFFISPITKDDFNLFDEQHESSIEEKENVCSIIKKIRYFYFLDKYNIQWEFEQGHDDIGE
ncbi:VOC family protein [Serratia symbiotica]|uniref:VOC family protein n=1 Tax=Serratia symbiotica TaxID=138074 RepID=UPI001CF0583A|nr:VOC family protein [Serratia symbiotica]